LKICATILFLLAILISAPKRIYSQSDKSITVNFCGDPVKLELDRSLIVKFDTSLSEESVQAFYTTLNAGKYHPLISALIEYKDRNRLNDWLYYQLIRRTAQQISPKAENYYRYTLYKWFLLTKSGYDASLAIGNQRLLFYVRSDDNIYDIPRYLRDGKQYVCLNYHDYGYIDFEKDKMYETYVDVHEAQKPFSYKVTQLPGFKADDYSEKEISFKYRQKMHYYKLALNTQVQAMFTNYPEVDFESYFNIPMSANTYSSLIPVLKKELQGMNQKKAIDYLMQFTRHAFMYKNDQNNFGKEKRLSPEQTLLYQYSDCDDRAALFFYLVKEIYNLPMIVMVYPAHVTIAVKLDKPVGDPILYKGNKYSVCEPTPQMQELRLGQLSSELKNLPFEVVYEYNPQK